MAISKNILVVGPYYKKDGLLLSISPHNAEVGVVKALKELGHEVSILDCRNTTFVNSLDHISSCNDVVSLIKGKITDCMFDIILVMGPKLPDPLILSGVWDNIKALKVLWTSEPIKLPEYKQLIIKNKDYFDQIFTFDESEISIYESLGIKAKFLPQAFNPSWYKPLNILRKEKLNNSFVFIGSIGGNKWCNRPYFLNLVKNLGYKVNIGTVFDANKINEIYNSHQAVLNIGLYIESLGKIEDLRASGYTQRVFEAYGAGKVCITHEVNDNKLFEHGVDILYYNKNNIKDILALASDNDQIKKMESNIINDIEKHSYKSRMKQFLGMIDGDI